MSNIPKIFAAMADRYQPGKVDKTVSYYFSVGDHKYTARCHPDRAEVTEGRPSGSADCVLKCDPKLFEKMVLQGKKPGPLDIARGKIKTNSVEWLQRLPELFHLGR
jgi:hypothetical protein